jgi:hypothetical protein
MGKVRFSAETLQALRSPLTFDEDGEQDSRILALSYREDRRIERIRELMITRRELTMTQIGEIVSKEIPG